VGGALKRGISGGEKKRTAIGAELICGAPILFLDEPTSGLDSSTALTIIEILEEAATDGRTIISTLH
jgi:ABC-type multidrug transport system ATPase subunit